MTDMIILFGFLKNYGGPNLEIYIIPFDHIPFTTNGNFMALNLLLSKSVPSKFFLL